MKEKELRENSTCNICGKKIGHTGIPLFWRVTIQRYGLKLDAIQRQTGLAMMLGGNGILAQVMGTDEDMAEKMSEKKITICESCAVEKSHNLAELAMEK